MLFGPTSRPNEHPATGAVPNAIPDQASTWYPALQAAAQDPDAPANVRQLFSLVNMLMSK